MSNFLKIIFESLKPYRYRGLSQRTVAKTTVYFILLSLLYVLVMGAVNAPRYYDSYTSTGTNLSKFETFEIGLTIKTKEPVILSQSPKIIIDTEANRSLRKNEDILLTSDKLYHQSFLGKQTFDIAKFDILQNIDIIKRNKLLLLAVVIPAMIAVAFTFVFLKYLMIILIFAALTILLATIRRLPISVFSAFKIATYAITIYYISNIFASIFNVKYLGMLIYIIFYATVLFLMKDDDVSVAVDSKKKLDDE